MAYTTIDDPSAYFQTTLYTGDGSSSQAQTNTGNSNLQPDWIWIKKRNDIRNTTNTDSSRGFNKRLETQTTVFETTTTTDVISAQSNGFTVGNNGSTGLNGDTYVAWQWKANGGTTTTNDASATGIGDIDSVYQANTTSGFSIVTHTGSGSAGNIAHGLGVAPEWILTKNRSQAASWANYHVGIGAQYYLELDTTDAQETASSVWGDTTPSSTTFRVGGANTKNNSSSDNFVSYCFTSIQGYSKFGKYTGNGSADGPFIYTGFKPAWLMVKGTSTGREWFIFDGTRDTYNPFDTYVKAEASDAEADSTFGDFLSNGFKVRSGGASYNTNGQQFIYMAFAESPFVSSEGVPTTAR